MKLVFFTHNSILANRFALAFIKQQGLVEKHEDRVTAVLERYDNWYSKPVYIRVNTKAKYVVDRFGWSEAEESFYEHVKDHKDYIQADLSWLKEFEYSK